ncbi:hypothetical protein ACFWXK_09015 [Streptomyces sp. NPDC059070]|uniref:hypothetical protein n=1 Tax=Streptomyces sp. NPDC059070 TaxID=3346713 RepID=UPI0036A76431
MQAPDHHAGETRVDGLQDDEVTDAGFVEPSAVVDDEYVTGRGCSYASRKMSTLPVWRAGATRPATRPPATAARTAGGAQRTGTRARRHASAMCAVVSAANLLPSSS